MSREGSASVESNTPETEQMQEACPEETCDAVDEEGEDEFPHPIPWQKIESQGLDCDYGLLFSKEEANRLFMQLEEEVEYFTGTDCAEAFRGCHIWRNVNTFKTLDLSSGSK